MSNLNESTQALHPFLFKVRDTISAVPHNLAAVKLALVELLVYLNSTEGRTSESCITTDTFFRLHDVYGFNWFHLPEELRLILDDIGGQLHDTVEHPDMVSNYASTPEQLLERLHSLSC